MRSSFRWRLTGTFLILIATVLVVTGIILSLWFKNYYLDQVRSSLAYEAVLVADMTRFNQGQANAGFLQEITDKAALHTDSRITIVDSQGKVLADSQFDPSNMGFHHTRPEIHQALQGKQGADIRRSDTADIRMLYVAVPFDNGYVKGAVRLAKPIQQVEALYKNVLIILLMAIFITGLVACIISIAVAERFSRPLQEVTEAVGDMARGNFKCRVSYQHDDELGVLAEAVNNMAGYLDDNIKEMAEVNNRLEILLTNTINGILMVGSDSRVTYANPMALELLNADGNYAGKKHVEFIGNYHLIELIDRVKARCRPIRQEVILQHLNTERVVEVNAVPILNREKDILEGVLVVLNDITEIKKLERIRKDFVANVSHELKTPVATISGFAETLTEESRGSNTNVQEFSKIIYDEAQRLNRIINRLLELSRLESEKPFLNLKPVDLKHLILANIDLVKQQNKSEQLYITTELPVQEVIIETDSDLIIQVLANLLDNAIKYTPEPKYITIRLQEEPDQVIISVEDNGEGIPEAEASRIFERFYRLDKARSRKTGGTGLGLAIVKHLVDNLSGQVGVDSPPGGGSRFFFTIPRNLKK